MSAFVNCEGRPRAGRSWRGLVVGALTIAIGLTLGGTPVRADQTVSFDGAGGAPHISLIGDSTLTGVRWYADYGALERFNFVLSAESCRRTIEQSCFSREGYRSENVLTAMNTLEGDLGEVLVRSQGVDTVVWLTLRTSSDVDYSDPQEQTSTDTFAEFNEQLVQAASESDGYLQVADWATYSNGATSWFEYDGVHLRPSGVDALTTFLAGTVERVLAGEDVSPAAAPWTVLVPGAEGDVVTEVQSALIGSGIEVDGGADGIYGNDTMAAVAEYQRVEGDLQVTGAVDAATARSLGVYDTADETSQGPPEAPDAPSTPSSVGDIDASADSASAGEQGGSGRAIQSWWIVTAILVLLGAAMVGRRRYVVSRRRARRRARVHPAASPHRSVADLRRSGDLAPSEDRRHSHAMD
jgi:hypothetical protein